MTYANNYYYLHSLPLSLILILNYNKSEKLSFSLLTIRLVTNKTNQTKHALIYVDFSYGDHLGCQTNTSLKE